MDPLLRKRRSGDKYSPNKSGDSNKGKGKKEQKKKGLRKVYYIFIALLIAGFSFAFVHFYNVVIHGPRIAKCLFDEPVSFFVHCKGREQHNKAMLQRIVGLVKKDMDAQSIADVSATFALAHTMRTWEIEIVNDVFDYMKDALKHINCYKLIDATSIDFQAETPRSICAAAVFRGNEGEMDNEKALEAFNYYNDLGFLLAIYGSDDLHEGTKRYTYEGQLISNDGEPIEIPKFSPPAHEDSLTFPTSYTYLVKRLRKTLNNTEKERLGATLLANEIRKSLAAMRRCNPPNDVTWTKYHSRAIFKRVSNKDVDEGCEWADASDTLWEKVENIKYDFKYSFRKMLSAMQQN